MDRETNARQLVSEIVTRWRQSGAPDAAQCLTRYPALNDQKSLALELAYEEYCLREEVGDSVDIEGFCGRFPSIHHSLRRRIEVHRYLHQHLDELPNGEPLPWPAVGEMFLGFRILQQLGRGGLARVYLCSQPSVGDRQIVIKIAHRGAYEADTLGRLKHQNIVPIYSVVEDSQSGMSGICMPFCGRSTLEDVLDLAFSDGRQPARSRVILEAANQHREANDRYDCVDTPDRRLRTASYVNGVLHLGVQLAAALQHAHEQQILHGDLKPSNVLVTPGGTPMLLDFNLSHNPRHRTGMTGGTLPYMAPEQLRSTVLHGDNGQEDQQLDHGSDVYSLGTILYQLLCGQLPFEIAGKRLAVTERARQQITAQRQGPLPLNHRGPAIDPRLARFIGGCLAFDPAERPASMAAVVHQLAHHLNVNRRVVRWARVNRRSVLAGAVGLALTGGSGVALVLTRDPYALRELDQGRTLYRRGQFDAACRHFAKAVDADPELADALWGLGRAHVKLGEQALSRSSDQQVDHWDKALVVFRKLSEESPYNGRDDACRGYCLNRSAARRSPDFARTRYEQALAAGFRSIGLYNNLGYSHFALGDLDKAQAALQHALDMNPNLPVVYLNFAEVDLQRAAVLPGYVPEAGIDAINMALRRWPERHPQLCYAAARLCGYAARSQPEYEKTSLQYLRRAVALGYGRPRDFALDPALEPVRRSHYRAFQQLLRSPQPATPPPPLDRLLDPIDE